MGLRDLQLPTETIDTPGGSFTVRGLSFSDIMILVNSHGPQVAALYSTYVDGGDLNMQDFRKAIPELLNQAPRLIAQAIALASNDGSQEAVDIAVQLPVNAQLDALDKLFRLTLTSEAELKKLLERLIDMISGTNGALQMLQTTASGAGFGEPEDR